MSRCPGSGGLYFCKPMPPQDDQDEPDQQPRASFRERLKLLAGKLRAPVVWAATHRWIAAAIAAGAVLLLSGGVAAWIWLCPGRSQTPAVSTDEILAALDRGAVHEARGLAERAIAQWEMSAVSPAIVSLALGMATAQEAEKAGLTAGRSLYLVSARYFEEALVQDLPEDRRAETVFRLGKSLHDAGQMPASRSALSEALKLAPQRGAEIRLLLAATHLREQVPHLAEALAENKLYLADDKLSASQRDEGIVQQAEILLAMGKAAECRAAAEKVPHDSKQHAAAAVLCGRALIYEAQALKAKGTSPDLERQAAERFRLATSTLREILDEDVLKNPAGRQATYLVGVYLLESGDGPGALGQFGRLRQCDPLAPEYLAAAYQEATLLRAAGRNREAAAGYCRALKAVGEAESYRNPWVSLEQLRHRVAEAYQSYLEKRDFALGLQLAQSAAGAFSPDRAFQMEAETYRAWGRDLIAQAEGLARERADALAREGRLQLRRASRLYQRLAKRRITTRYYPDDLWDSATCALEGRDFRSACRLFEEFLKQQPRSGLAQAMAGLGEAFLSLDRVDDAVAMFEKCIRQHPRDVAAIRARLLASQAFLEKGEPKSAERLLEENLNGESLTPASKEYRDSLLALGTLLHQGKRYEEAIRRLDEVVSRYGASRQAIEARYLIADCHRQRATSEAGKLAQDLVEQSRAARARRMREGFTSALEGYRQTQQTLLKCQETVELAPAEKLMLRNCYFFTGGMLMELGQYEAAVKAYALATSRYPNLPETLEALVQMARGFRAVNKPSEARGAIEQAKLLLARMPPQTSFQETGNYSRTQWSELLEREL